MKSMIVSRWKNGFDLRPKSTLTCLIFQRTRKAICSITLLLSTVSFFCFFFSKEKNVLMSFLQFTENIFSCINLSINLLKSNGQKLKRESLKESKPIHFSRFHRGKKILNQPYSHQNEQNSKFACKLNRQQN